MCVNGSLIRSSTWRSSSVSAPCISSSICLPSSPERSRTMRGSFCQALPIGCIRVFMTPSCSSAVTLESRCSGTLNSVSSLRREISSSWLRVSTSSETMVIRCSSVSTLTRIDWLAILSASWHVGIGGGSRLLGGLGLGVLGSPAGFGRLRLRAAGAARRRRERRRDHFGLGLAERALQFVERDFAGTQRPLQHLRHQRALGRLPASASGCTGGAATAGAASTGASASAWLPPSAIACSCSIRSCRCPRARPRWPRAGQNFLDAVDRGQDQRHRFGRDRHAVAEFAHQGLAGMRQRFQPRQPQEAAGALDGVNQTENLSRIFALFGSCSNRTN